MQWRHLPMLFNRLAVHPVPCPLSTTVAAEGATLGDWFQPWGLAYAPGGRGRRLVQFMGSCPQQLVLRM